MRPPLGRAFASLTSRLVLTAVALVVLVAVLIGVAATAALKSQLTHQLDDNLHAVSGVRPGPLGSGPGELPPGVGRPGSRAASEGHVGGRLVGTVDDAGHVIWPR